jgi:hypothetical protein
MSVNLPQMDRGDDDMSIRASDIDFEAAVSRDIKLDSEGNNRVLSPSSIAKVALGKLGITRADIVAVSSKYKKERTIDPKKELLNVIRNWICEAGIIVSYKTQLRLVEMIQALNESTPVAK